MCENLSTDVRVPFSVSSVFKIEQIFLDEYRDDEEYGEPGLAILN